MRLCSLPHLLSSPSRCCHAHDCCYRHLKLHHCHYFRDHYNYTFSQGDIQCCECLDWGLQL